MLIDLTDKEFSDLRKGLVMAMKVIDDDNEANDADRILCDNLEKIESKLSDIQAQQ